MIDYEQRALNENESLRRQNAKLTHELAHAESMSRAMHAQRRRRESESYAHCVYCGTPCKGKVCRAHADLTRLDEMTA